MQVTTNLSELEVTVVGDGEPVLLIHGAFFGGSLNFGGVFDSLCEQAELSNRYRLITYDRHGYGQSSKPDKPFTCSDVVADSMEVLRQTGADRAHVVGHSAGGLYGLQFAMEHPEAVHSLTLIEPTFPTPEWGAFLAQHFAPAGESFAAGDNQTAFERVFGAVCGGADFRSEMDPRMPEGWYERAIADLDYMFTFETQALDQFTFGPDDAERIRQPVLLMRGEKTEPVWIIHQERLKEWIPHAQESVVRDANHMVQVWNPESTARALVSFLESHPLEDRAASRV